MKDMQSSAGCGHNADVPARSPFSLMQGSARTAALKEQMRMPEEGAVIRNVLLARGYMQPVEGETAMLAVPMRRANAFASLLTLRRHVYKDDLIMGSVRGLFAAADKDELKRADSLCAAFGGRSWVTNYDHFAPDYGYFLSNGIAGIMERLRVSAQRHEGERREFALAQLKCMESFSGFVQGYALDAEKAGNLEAAKTLRAIAQQPPKTFRQALQLVWLAHTAFVIQGRFAMALGRMDQYLWPYYNNDIKQGRLTGEQALELVCSAFMKIGELRTLFGADDVVNIAIGGVDREGKNAVNDLSRIILEAVRICNIPGPNLSARISSVTPKDFIKDCLRVIGTGIGYPALMNDDVNIASLVRRGVDISDARDYCMVGCIENFLPGKQPPWCDGRYNTPKFLELALNGGRCMLTGDLMGEKTKPAAEIASMQELLEIFKMQMEFAARDYVLFFGNENSRCNPRNYTQPFVSCFCPGCVESGLSINDGGTPYPSVHGVGLMGIATVADSLAAIEKVVFEDKFCTLERLVQALRDNFAGEGDAEIRARLIAAPKYGNNDEYADKYARFFVDEQYEIFRRYTTPDGGEYSLGIASNIANIGAGSEIAATADGRYARMPISDAASATPGRDKHGPGAALLSLSKPDYTKSALGTVVNQKYTPNAFREDKLDRLASMVQVYFAGGGQEVQINAVSREVLKDAMEHPENYSSLIVRVSGFSAYYTTLSRDVQEDILRRTEHEG